MGSLAEQGRIEPDAIRKAMAYGSVVASFGVEAFSLERLQRLTRGELEHRFHAFENMISLTPADH
jgi:hypothetical protein